VGMPYMADLEKKRQGLRTLELAATRRERQ
jgi:hypothetical protein